MGYLQIVPGEFPAGMYTPMKHAAAKVGGNQGRMVGRRRAVGFLQIVPSVFPTGMVNDRLRLAAVEWASRPLRQDGS